MGRIACEDAGPALIAGSGSVPVGSGPDQLEDVLAFDLDQGGEDRSREAPVLKVMAHAGIADCRLDPAQVRAFARGRGQRAKTDAIDTRMIALCHTGRPSASAGAVDQRHHPPDDLPVELVELTLDLPSRLFHATEDAVKSFL